MRRPAADRSCAGVHNTVTEPDRRRPGRANPNSRLNAAASRLSSSHPQGRDATMQHEPSSSSGSSSSLSLSLLPVAGIDVSKSTLDVFIDLVNQAFSMANDDQGRPDLIGRLRAANVRLVLIEATGRHHRKLSAELLEAGFQVVVVNPQRAREFARSMGQLEKTDRIYARMMAEFARRMDHRPMEKPKEQQSQLDDLISRRRALVQMRIAEKNRQGEESQPRLARDQARKMLRLIEQQIEDLDRAVAKLIEDDDEWSDKSRLITSIPGIGQGTAQQLIADLPELGKLDRGQIAKLVGVAPINCDSGVHRGRRAIRGGRGPVRCALYMGAFNAMHYNPRFKAYAQRLRDKGKHFKVILTACMRKLVTILNQMIKTNTTWNEKLAFNLP